MKPAPFHYEAPRCIAAALALLDDDAKALAGGQSLVPMLNFRLARPARLVDLNPIAELTYLRRSDGKLHIGALTRHATLERSGVVARGWPLLTQAVRLVGHAAIRSRGTVGGSAAHADPAAELPAALTALDARFELISDRGGRSLSAAEFFRGRMTTALQADELLREIVVPALDRRGAGRTGRRADAPAAGVHRTSRPPMWLLHRRLPDDGRGAAPSPP